MVPTKRHCLYIILSCLQTALSPQHGCRPQLFVASMAVAKRWDCRPGQPEVAHTGSQAHHKLAAYLHTQHSIPLRWQVRLQAARAQT